MRLRALAALGLVSLGFAVLAPAASAHPVQSAPHDYPASICSTLSVSTENPAPGQPITISGANFGPNASVHLVLTSTKPAGAAFLQKSAVTAAATTYDVGTFQTDASGAFSTSYTAPAATTNAGHFYIIATSGASKIGSCPADPFQSLDFGSAGVSSGPISSGSSSGGTANTGLDIAALLAVAALLVGGGFLINRRGRRTHSRV